MDLTPKLPLRQVVPFWTLPDKHGQPYNLAKQRGRDHLLLLIFQPGIDPQPYLRTLAAATTEWRELPARGIVVVASADAAGALGSQPFSVLIDERDTVRSRFLPAGAQAGVFALDRYGDLYQQWLVTTAAELPSAADVSGWLQAIAMQCSI